jgi:hypothetical protein
VRSTPRARAKAVARLLLLLLLVKRRRRWLMLWLGMLRVGQHWQRREARPGSR